MTDLQRLSIITIVRDDQRSVDRLLGSIEVTQRDVNDRAELEVVVDDSAEPVSLSSRPFHTILVRLDGNGNRSAARNAGAAATAGSILSFVDSDQELPEHWARVHLAWHRERPEEFVAGYRLRRDPESDHWRPELRSRVTTVFSENSSRLAEAQYLAFSCKVSVGAAPFAAVRGFDEGFAGWGYEDSDFGYRLHRVGVRTELAPRGQSFDHHHAVRLDEARVRGWRANRQCFLARHPDPVAQATSLIDNQPPGDALPPGQQRLNSFIAFDERVRAAEGLPGPGSPRDLVTVLSEAVAVDASRRIISGASVGVVDGLLDSGLDRVRPRPSIGHVSDHHRPMRKLLRSSAGGCPFAVAMVTGIISAGFPVTLLRIGFDKHLIVAFFIINSIIAFSLAITSVRVRRPDIVARCLPTAAGVSILGLALVALGRMPALVFSGGVLSMAFVVVSRFIIRLTGPSTKRAGFDAEWSAGVRWIAVLGQVVGVGMFGIASPAWPAIWGTPVSLAPVSTLVGIGFAIRVGSRHDREQLPDRSPERLGVLPRAAFAALLTGIALVVLPKGADSLRLVYLPLLVVASGWSPSLVRVFFVTAALIELAILPVIGRRVSTASSGRALAVGAVFGAATFALTAAVGSITTVIIAQMLFALFAALYQSLSPLVLGSLLGDGLAAGTGIFAGLLQVGSLAGVAAPLAVPGCHRSLFWIAVVLCAVPATLLVTVVSRRSRREAVVGHAPQLGDEVP